MASAAFDASNSTAYAEITWDETQVSNLNDNLVYDLSLLDSTWWNAQTDANGGDIRITGEGTAFGSETAYSFELENFQNNGDGTGTGIIFFDSSKASSTGSAETWRVYCGDTSLSLPADSDTLGAHNVWNSNYKMVLHKTGADSSEINDSTANNNDVATEGDSPTYNETGQLGNAVSYDGSNDYLEVARDTSIEPQNITVQAWVNKDSQTGIKEVIDKGDEGSDAYTLLMWDHDSDSSLEYVFRLNDPNNNNTDAKGSTGITTSQFQMVHGTYDKSNLKLYLNGNQDGSTSASHDITYNNNEDLRIGARLSNANYLDGDIDEVRVLSTALSANWISTEYNNQSSPSTFWTTGATQEPVTAGSVRVTSSGVNQTSSGVISTQP